MKPAKFLDKYQTIIFDMDGVITSEQNYWNIAALAAYELLNDKLYYGSGTVGALAQSNFKEIRSELFANDSFITAAKEKGVNSNWDLCYLAFCYMVCGMFPSPSTMADYVKNSDKSVFDLYAEAAQVAAKSLELPVSQTLRGEMLWQKCRDVFQEWYLGDELFEETYGVPSKKKGKTGMWQTEEPIVPADKITLLLKTLCEGGKKLGIGTGRKRFELELPLKRWDCLKYFTPSATVDYDYIIRGEENLRKAGINAQLTKPHPYIFLKGVFGIERDDVSLYKGEYDSSVMDKVLIVGDAGCDILAAKAMGADFMAVLTGINGEKGRAYFEEVGAEYIFNNVLSMIEE